MLDGYALSSDEATALAAQLKSKVAAKAEGHVREAALTRLSRMKDRCGAAGGACDGPGGSCRREAQGGGPSLGRHSQQPCE